MLTDAFRSALPPLWYTHCYGGFRITQFPWHVSAAFIPPSFIFRRIRDRTK